MKKDEYTVGMYANALKKFTESEKVEMWNKAVEYVLHNGDDVLNEKDMFLSFKKGMVTFKAGRKNKKHKTFGRAIINLMAALDDGCYCVGMKFVDIVEENGGVFE